MTERLRTHTIKYHIKKLYPEVLMMKSDSVLPLEIFTF